MNWDAPLNLKPCCLNLRHKLMYCDPRQATPGMVDDNSETRVYLCMESQEVLGPDGKPVAPSACAAGRACYKAPALVSPPVMPTIDRMPDRV
jgi:hypothetical protein